MSASKFGKAALAAALALSFSLAAVGEADARRGGGFGSRGMRTYRPPPSTATAPQQAAPIQRSMTPNTPGAQQPATASPSFQRPGQPQPARGGFLQRWGGPILGGLLVGGLLGMLMGHGFGGAAGMLAMLVQVALVVGVVGLLMALFRRRSQPAAAASAADTRYARSFERFDPPASQPQPMSYGAAAQAVDGEEIRLADSDFEAFERLLAEVQDAFTAEDYARLRQVTTPEVMSYLAEELSANAVAGRRNEVRDVRLLQGDLAEAWREGGKDYATVAMRYSSIDLMRDRASGRVVEGDERTATETVEVWTFVRDREGPWGPTWRLSAIQDLEAA
jgi:predicted lipid-binding transport protein (Tim44 family)